MDYMNSREIETLRTHILNMLSYISTNKHRMQSQDYKQLTNHLQFSLNTLSNMNNMLLVKQTNGNKKLIYNHDGTTSLVDYSTTTTGEDWEKQFDESLLQRPPSYQHPPQSLTNIKKIKQAERL